jgi:hypothetical protein
VIWAVYNGYFGNGACCVLVEAESEKSAFEQAVDAFAADDKRPDFWTPNPRWYSERIQFPYVCELS